MRPEDINKATLDRLSARIRGGGFRGEMRDEFARQRRELEGLAGLIREDTIPGRAFESLRHHSTKQERLPTGAIVDDIKAYYPDERPDGESVPRILGSINSFLIAEHAGYVVVDMANMPESQTTSDSNTRQKSPEYLLVPLDSPHAIRAIKENTDFVVEKKVAQKAADEKQPEKRVFVLAESLREKPKQISEAVNERLYINDLAYVVTSFLAIDRLDHIPTDAEKLKSFGNPRGSSIEASQIKQLVMERVAELAIVTRPADSRVTIFSYAERNHHEDSEYRAQKDITSPTVSQMWKETDKRKKELLKEGNAKARIPHSEMTEEDKRKEEGIIKNIQRLHAKYTSGEILSILLNYWGAEGQTQATATPLTPATEKV